MHEEHQQTLKRRRIHSIDMIKYEKHNMDNDGCEIARMADLKTEVDECNNIRELTEDDVYTQLALKESDLALAKEVGEALLAENVELREKYEGFFDLHTNQIEVLKQEKHDIKLKGKRVESIQDEKIRELTKDLGNLHNKLKTLQAASQNDVRSRRQNVQELIEENTRLDSELTKVSNTNKELLEINRLQKMQQARSRIDSYDSEQKEADVLRQKLVILEQEREFLDTSINELVADKNEYGNEVHRLTQKVILLTEELADSKSELSLCEEELNSSKKKNAKLQEQLDEFKLQTSQQVALSETSIFSEISMLESECEFSMKLAESPSFKRLKQVSSLQGTPKPLAASSSRNLFKQQEDQSLPAQVSRSSDSSLDESDDGDDVEDGFVLKQQGFFAQLEEEQKVNMELRKEMGVICHKLLDACRLLTNDTYEKKQTMDIDDHFLKDDAVAGTLTVITTEMVDLLKEYLDSQQGHDESFFEEENEQERLLILETQVEDLTTECFEAKKQLSSLGIQLDQSRKENVKKDDQMGHLLETVEDLTTECFEAKKQLSSLGIQLEQSRKENVKKDDQMGHLLATINNQQSEIESLKNIGAAQKNSAKLSGSQSVMEELEKAKIDVENLDNQLLVAINQKIKLSEQLEQWQYDMASMIEVQVQKQLKNTANERVHPKRRNSRLPFINKGWNWTS